MLQQFKCPQLHPLVSSNCIESFLIVEGKLQHVECQVPLSTDILWHEALWKIEFFWTFVPGRKQDHCRVKNLVGNPSQLCKLVKSHVYGCNCIQHTFTSTTQISPMLFSNSLWSSTIKVSISLIHPSVLLLSSPSSPSHSSHVTNSSI